MCNYALEEWRRFFEVDTVGNDDDGCGRDGAGIIGTIMWHVFRSLGPDFGAEPHTRNGN